MIFEINSACDQGVVRAKNEDAISHGKIVALQVAWMVIADGVGGNKAGEVASHLLTAHIQEAIADLAKTPEQGWQAWIAQQIELANEVIYVSAEQNASYHGMSTTGVVVVIENNQCNVAWVGDSRAYGLSDSKLTQHTQDHTMINFLLNKGAITAEEAENSNTKNLLSKAIGNNETVKVDCVSWQLKPGDTIMLSTDGLHDSLSKAQLLDAMEKSKFRKDICSDMITQAIEQGSKDNITVGLINIINSQ